MLESGETVRVGPLAQAIVKTLLREKCMSVIGLGCRC
jgi:hypothetical protein